MAVPVRTASPRPVGSAFPRAIAERLATKIDASPLLRVAESASRARGRQPPEPPAAAIIGDDALTVLDGGGWR